MDVPTFIDFPHKSSVSFTLICQKALIIVPGFMCLNLNSAGQPDTFAFNKAIETSGEEFRASVVLSAMSVKKFTNSCQLPGSSL